MTIYTFLLKHKQSEKVDCTTRTLYEHTPVTGLGSIYSTLHKPAPTLHIE